MPLTKRNTKNNLKAVALKITINNNVIRNLMGEHMLFFNSIIHTFEHLLK